MKKYFSTKRIIAAATMLCAVSIQSFADDFNIVWVKALTTPANAGLVYVDYGLDDFEESMYSSTSEFKRTSNATTSAAYILTKPAEGWLYAGLVRDMNMNGLYDADEDRQIHVWYNNFFTAFYDHTNFHGQSSSDAQSKAEQALANCTKPTDQVIAVFTQGAAAYRAEDEEAFGKVYCSNLANKPGDMVTFYAYGDCDDRTSPNSYYKFDSWRDANGNEVSREREFTITVKGMERYYAHFVKTTKTDYNENEKPLFPDRYKFDYNNSDWNPSEFTGIESINAEQLKTANAIYDLQGRRVSQIAKGVFVKNGKKIVVK